MGSLLGKGSKAKVPKDTNEQQIEKKDVLADELVVSCHHDGGLQGHRNEEMKALRQAMAQNKKRNQQEAEAKEKQSAESE